MPPLFVHSLINPLSFALRRALRFRRRGYHEGPLELDSLSPSLRAQLTSPRARELEARYGLAAYRHRLAHAAYTKSLFALDVLDRVPEFAPRDAVRLLDIGAKNFEAAPGLHGFAARRSYAFPSVTGVEIDAYPIYRNLYSRADAAHYYLSLLPGEHRYLAGDIRAHTGQYDLITWFFPFLTPSPLLWWGLPGRYLAPEANFRHVLDLLAPGGTLVTVNYPNEEADIQRELFAGAGLTPWTMLAEGLIGRGGQAVYISAYRA